MTERRAAVGVGCCKSNCSVGHEEDEERMEEYESRHQGVEDGNVGNVFVCRRTEIGKAILHLWRSRWDYVRMLAAAKRIPSRVESAMAEIQADSGIRQLRVPSIKDRAQARSSLATGISKRRSLEKACVFKSPKRQSKFGRRGAVSPNRALPTGNLLSWRLLTLVPRTTPQSISAAAYCEGNCAEHFC